MFCPECGKRIDEGSAYCPYCGKKLTHTGASPSAPNSPNCNLKEFAQAQHEMTDLKQAFRSNRRRPSRKLLHVIVIALALALATSVAYAAYYVYTNVWVPSQQTQQQPTEEAAPTYTVNTVTVNVSVPSDVYSNSGKREEDTWYYPQIVSSVHSDAIDNINRRIQETMEGSAEKTSDYPANWSEINNLLDSGSDEYATCTLSRGMEITYMDNDIVCVHDACYATGWGAHGFHFSQSQTYDLKTGEVIDPWTVFGMDEDEAISATGQAVKTYLSSNPSDLLTPSEAAEGINDRISNYNTGYSLDQSSSAQTFSPFVITNEGLVYMTGDYELGSYAFGTRNILVEGFDSNAKPGTAVDLKSPQIANE